MTSLDGLQKQSPAYIEFLQKELFERMMYVIFFGIYTISCWYIFCWYLFLRTAGPEVVPPQIYDYTTLNSFALQNQLAAEDSHSEDPEVDGQGEGDGSEVTVDGKQESDNAMGD
jgi:hypothetical protein